MAPLGKIGVEIELMAPAGKSREDLAIAIADRLGGRVTRFFHPQGEPSKVANTPVFDNLTLGFDVRDREGQLLAQCVDDLTLQGDLDRKKAPKPGWYRVVSDDIRLLRLTMRHVDATAPLERALDPLASLFGTEVHHGEGGMVRVADETGSPIALGAPLPGERERPCELVTPPIETDHFERLEALLEPARQLGFTIPAEGALHLHFDGAPLCTASTVANLVRFLGVHGDALKDRFATNSRCTRLGRWPIEIFDVITSDGFAALDWEAARERLLEIKLTKFCDFNLFNLVHAPSGKHTFEVRIFPVWLEAEPILEAARYFTRIIDWARAEEGKLQPVPLTLDEWDGVPLGKAG